MKIGGDKMRNASGQPGENERQWKKANKNKSKKTFGEHYDISYVRCVNKMFHVVVMQNNEKKKCTKKCAGRAKLFFFLIRPTDFFFAALVPVAI